MIAFEDKMRRGGTQAIESAEKFFMKEDEVHQALRAITSKLEQMGIDYAVVGGMAITAHGYRRTTEDVDILVTRADNLRIREALDGLGYVPPFAGSKNLRDTQTGVRIEFLISGEFPGDGKPKPISFPNPSDANVVIEGVKYIRLDRLVELKLASGMTNITRLRDLADVQGLIQHLNLPRAFGERLDESVRAKFFEFWDALQSQPREQ